MLNKYVSCLQSIIPLIVGKLRSFTDRKGKSVRRDEPKNHIIRRSQTTGQQKLQIADRKTE